MTLSVNFDQAVTLIRTVGHTNTLLLQGAPGTGKSSLLTAVHKHLPEYLPCYIDGATLDIGDLAFPAVDKERMVTNYAPNARFGINRDSDRPVLLMLDELGKTSRGVMNMLLPVILEHRIGDSQLPPGSIVFGTTNLATDGVGDNLPAHAHNRMTVLDYANPTADEWIAWGSANGIAPEVLAFAKQFPHAFDRYDQTDDTTNHLIFNPLKGRTKAFCSPRSLHKASHLIAARHALGDALLPALAGTVGESAARDMEAMVHLADQIPTYDAVVASPAKAKLPTNAGGFFLMAFSLAGRCKPEDLDAVMTYVNRWENESFEALTLFVMTLAGNSNKVGWACRNRAYTAQAAKLGRFF